MSTWQTNTLRLTAFPSPSFEIDNQDWWTEAVGVEPETTTSKRQLGERTFEGKFSGGNLKLSISPLRIEWFYSPLAETPPEEGVRLLTLGSLEEKLPIFQDLITRWLNNAKTLSLVRVAFGAVLLQPVNERSEGYNVLIPYLKNVKIDVENSSDFLYQINRRRDSTTGIQNLSINRLSKWGVLRLQLGIGLSVTPGIIRELPNIYATNLEIDINTTPDYDGEFNHGQVLAICNELIDLGKEITEKGDIP